MKKLFSIVSVLVIVGLTMFHTASASTLEIGMGWAGKSGMANRVAQGFEEGLKKFAPGVKVEYQKELASVDDLAGHVARWQASKKGMVLLRSNAAKWLGKNSPSIPTFIGGCNHPGQLGAIANLDAPEGNITGVTYFLSAKSQFQIFKEIIPNMTSILLLLGSGNPSAGVDQEGTKAVCREMNITYQEQFCASGEEAVAAVKQWQGKVSVIIVGNQAVVMDKTDQIVAAAGKTPVVAYASNPVKMGALCGFVADDIKLGYQLAQSMADVLLNGKAVRDVPVKVDEKPKFFVNAKTAQAIGLEIPYNLLEMATIIE